jgi:hypothetical protein
MLCIVMALAVGNANRVELADEWRLALARCELESRVEGMDADAYLEARLRLAGRTEREEVIQALRRGQQILEADFERTSKRQKEIEDKARKSGLLPPKPPEVK